MPFFSKDTRHTAQLEPQKMEKASRKTLDLGLKGGHIEGAQVLAQLKRFFF
jgi:hypothetical protein